MYKRQLEKPTPEEATLVDLYTSAKYFPANPGYLPFLDFGNRVVISQSSFDPYLLHGLSREQIATDLTDPTNPVTMDIVAAANYLSAATCLIDGDQMCIRDRLEGSDLRRWTILESRS